MFNIEMIAQNSITREIYDISELVSNIKWKTSFQSQPGTLTFDYIGDKSIHLPEGSVLFFKVDKKNVFFGYIFKRKQSEDEKISVTAYDQLRYLKNKDTYVFENMTASDIFKKILNPANLRHIVKNQSEYILPAKIHDNKSLFDMIQESIDLTLIYTGEFYMIRDNFGTIEFLKVNSLKTNLFIGDETLLQKYSLDTSIDSDTYNQIKLVQENKTTVKRDVYIVKDSETISQWGTLQYFETMNEDANPAQIKARAEMLLKVKNRVTKQLKLTCLGDIDISAGSGIIIGISKLKRENTAQNQYYIVTECTHNFSNSEHTMDLGMELSI